MAWKRKKFGGSGRQSIPNNGSKLARETKPFKESQKRAIKRGFILERGYIWAGEKAQQHN